MTPGLCVCKALTDLPRGVGICPRTAGPGEGSGSAALQRRLAAGPAVRADLQKPDMDWNNQRKRFQPLSFYNSVKEPCAE